MSISLEDYAFELPESRIAQRPESERTASRLLVWRKDGAFEHRHFSDLVDLLEAADLLVLNDTRVLPARLRGRKQAGSAAVELLLVRPLEKGWEAMVRPGRRLREGSRVELQGGLEVEIGASTGDGLRRVSFAPDVDVIEHCHRHGHVPLPPYIARDDEEEDHERYQTVFAREEGSVAAPTAGLHFDEELLTRIREHEVDVARVTLHVGPGTFRPVEDRQLAERRLHDEYREVPAATLEAIRACRARGGRVIAVGTTVCRALESLPDDARETVRGETGLFIAPGDRFRFTDVLVTNFHLPRSSLLLLVAAFAGPRWREAYEIALEEGYRFYSYGDANWIEGTR